LVVTCEHCQTRFRLDDAALPARGARVRCSRCKTSFFVAHPTATHEEAIHEVVAESTGPNAGAPAPDEDLFDLDRSDLGVTSSDGSAAVSAAADGDEQWEFDEDPPRPAAPIAPPRQPPALSKEPPARPRVAPRQAPARETPETDAELDALGDPEEWDLIGGDAEKAIREMRFVEETPAPSAPPAHAASRVAPIAGAPARETASSFAFAPARSFTPPSVGALANSVAWFAAIVLFAFGMRAALTPLPVRTPAARAAEATFALVHGQATDVAVTRMVTAFGPLTVVSGRYEPTRPSLLRVRWADAKGAAVGEGALAGPALAEAELREVAPERLAEQLARSAGAIATGGRFHALLPPAPKGATSAALSQEPLPTPPPPPALPAEPSATASSPPPPLPSSE
jgi:predicted Zn finger-like uncharacterized protein